MWSCLVEPFRSEEKLYFFPAGSTIPSPVLLGLVDPEDERFAILPNFMNYSFSRTSPHFIRVQSESSAATLCDPAIPDHKSFYKYFQNSTI